MQCKFLKHGLAIGYDQIVKPCCAWQITESWRQINHIQQVNLPDWHKSAQLTNLSKLLDQNLWPEACIECQKIELQGRQDSMRGNANNAYKNYSTDDITLEIRPGNTCNFACQTCWPEASSRVAKYHNQAGLIDLKDLESHRIENFDFLLPVASRIRDVVLLGGEPFYDKSCLKFLQWANENLSARLLMFTNGSMIDRSWLSSYPGQITLIFSLDAVGRPAEYIRYGTVWSEVLENFELAKTFDNVEVRVNITCSVFNYIHLEELIRFLSQDWPRVVGFGVPRNNFLKECTIPYHLRPQLKQSLQRTIDFLLESKIENDQQVNAVNAVSSIVDNLDRIPFDFTEHQRLIEFIQKMDQVKNTQASDYCDFLMLLQQKVN